MCRRWNLLVGWLVVMMSSFFALAGGRTLRAGRERSQKRPRRGIRTVGTSAALLSSLLMASELARDTQEAADFIRTRIGSRELPRVAVICGSGLSGLADVLSESVSISYDAIPNFAIPTVAGHASRLVYGLLGQEKIPTLAMMGRFHFYEGYPIKTTVFPVRVFSQLGIKVLVATNAAGGLNTDYKVGDICVISDHINLPGLVGTNALIGPNESAFGGERFTALSDAYDLALRRSFFKSARLLSLSRDVHEGTYCFVSGPTYETRAECRMLKSLGADLVGMSTVPEVCIGRHCNMKVLAVSLVTNAALFSAPQRGYDDDHDTDHSRDGMANHEEVLEASRLAAGDMQRLIVDSLMGQGL